MPRYLGILSDAHGNGPALDLALEKLGALGATRFLYLGDAVGYIPSLSALHSLQMLGSDVRCIRGNHEDMLLAGGYDSKQDAVYKLSAVHGQMNEGHLSMIENWGVMENIDVGTRRVLLVHGSPADPTYGYVYPDTDLSVFRPEAQLVFMGHSHHPFIRDHDGVRYVNVGSCGLPREDGRYGSAALYDTVSGDARIVRFDITAATAKALESSGPVHRSVHDVLARRRDRIFGDIL